jgi:hypothetical protein
MKSKLYKIFGVALTVVMLASLMVFAIPASANPGDNEWTKFAYPKAGADGKYFFDDTITYVGPLAMAINGNLYCAADPAGAASLMKSTDGGRTWSKLTKYTFGKVVDIVCSSENADVVYVADADYVYKTTNAGTSFAKVAPDSLDALFTTHSDIITALDVGYDSAGDPNVFISTKAAGYNGSVYWIKDVGGFSIAWEDLNLTGGYDVYAVNCPPNFETSPKIYAVITDGTETLVKTNTGPLGTWPQFGGDLLDTLGGAMVIEAASDICFPDDFDSDELFVGVSGSTVGDLGSVYLVVTEVANAYRLGEDDATVEADIVSLDITGDIGSTLLMAGAQDSTDVFSSTDGYGESWDAPSKAPSGSGTTYVLMAADFADSTTPSAWATTSSGASKEAAVSYTIDSGDLWNQISLISTNMAAEIRNVSFYPDYKTSGKLFFLTQDADGSDSLWRYDGKYWERVAEEGVLTTAIRMVSVSPTIATDGTVFFTNWKLWDPANITIYRSTNAGQSWKALRIAPTQLYNWLVIDAKTIIAGGDTGVVYKTDRNGDRVWTPTTITGLTGDIWNFARSGDNVLCGSDLGEVALSTDLGKTWAQVGDAFTTTFYTLVAFDTGYATNKIIYAACDDDIYRFTVGTSTAWTAIDGAITLSVASGIATADGCVYVSDANTVGGGMWRSVNPTDPATAVVFEQVGSTFKLAATSTLWWLQTTSASSTSGSNVLWAQDRADPTVLWTYTDNLVGPVVLATPATGTALGRITAVTLTWKELSASATDYDLKLYSDASFLAAYTVVNAATGSADEVYLKSGLAPGTTFYWKVRATAPLNSKWSTAWSFGTAMGAAEWNPFEGPVSEAPYPGQTNVPLRPAFAWNAADWATGYELEVSTAPGTTAGGYFVDALIGMTGTNALVNTAWQCNIDLDYSTTYYWHVKAVKGTTSASNWATGVFTTIAAPAAEVWTCPIDGLTFDSQAALQAHNAAAHAPVIPTTPTYIWIIVIIGAVLVIAVIVLIVTTRRTP